MKRRWKQQNDTKYLRQQSCSSFRLKKNSILCMPHYSNRLPLFIQFDTSSCFFSLLSSPLFSLTRSNETECVTAARVTTITCTFFQPHVRHATHTKSLFIIHNSFRLSHTIDTEIDTNEIEEERIQRKVFIPMFVCEDHFQYT